MPQRPPLKDINSHSTDDESQERDKTDLPNNISSGIRRRELLQLGGASAALSLLPACKKSKDNEKDKVKAPEVREINEISLGNVRFYLQDPNSISNEKKNELFNTLKKAYGKLKGYLGEEVMTYPDPIDVPIELRLDQVTDGKAAIGRVQLSNEQGKLNNNGQVVLINRQVPVLLSLNDISEKNIAHEFVHLYAQGTAFWTEGFWEGHAHAIENTLYPSDSEDLTFSELISNKGVSKALDHGLDFSQYDRTLKGGIQSPLLYRMALTKWDLSWREFIKQDPDFFKKFYKEVAKQKKEGKTSFNKEVLIKIGVKVSDKFAEWFKNTRCLQGIGETEPQKVFSANIIKSKKLLFVVGFNAHPRKLTNGQYTPAFLQPLAQGRLKIGTSTGSYYVAQWDNFSALSRLPDESIINDPTLQIQIVK